MHDTKWGFGRMMTSMPTSMDVRSAQDIISCAFSRTISRLDIRGNASESKVAAGLHSHLSLYPFKIILAA